MINLRDDLVNASKLHFKAHIEKHRINIENLLEKNGHEVIQLFRDNVGKRTPFIVEKDYDVLRSLMQICIEKRVGEILSIYNKDHKLVASGFFLKHKTSITILMSSTDFNYRKNGENTFLIDRAIFKFQKIIHTCVLL
jgi:hypothetical protein